MRRTALSALALACTAVLATTAPAFADDPSPVPSVASEAPPTPVPSDAPEPAQEASPVPSKVSEGEVPPTENGGQVAVVPSGAPDTGVTAESSEAGAGGLIGGGAAAVLVAGGATFFVVRRRRATGA
ncbi:sortase-dependent protein [Streptomyces sp. NPDC002845]